MIQLRLDGTPELPPDVRAADEAIARARADARFHAPGSCVYRLLIERCVGILLVGVNDDLRRQAARARDRARDRG